MLQKIELYIRKYHMIDTKDHIIAGVSGGADSICLLMVLLQLKEKLGFTISVVHVEHGIRGSDSLADAAFVRHFCGQRGIACHIYHYAVPEYAKAHGMGEEEAGRRLRYASFGAEKKAYEGYHASFSAEKGNYDGGADRVKIATAHHLDDNGETMLFHLARGSGISGLAGIAPVYGDIIRPLLCVSRMEIEQYLEQAGQAYCMDATNDSDVYARNKIRHQLMPILRQINSQAARHMYQAAEELREVDAYINKQAQKKLHECCKSEENGVLIEAAPFERQELVLQKEMLHCLLVKLEGGRDITRKHIHELLALFEKQAGRQVHLPRGWVARRCYEGVWLYDGKKEKSGAELAIDMPQQFSFRVFEDFSNKLSQISKKKYTKCFDYDKIKFGFCIRNRLPGDYLVINDSGCRQKLKKYFVNEKIPAKEREQLLLLADGSHIMWVVGHRISSFYKVDAYTRRILEVTFHGGEESE